MQEGTTALETSPKGHLVSGLRCAPTDRPPVNSARPPVIPPIKLREFTEFLVGSAPRSQGLWRSQV